MPIKTRWIVLAVIALALAASVWRALSARHQQQQEAATPAPALARVELASPDVWTLAPREITQTLEVAGTIKALNYAVIKARVAGEIKEFTVREGDAVKAGQVLARIDPTEYQRRWLQAKEQADAAKAQMEIAQRQWDTNKALVDQGFIAKTALDNSQASYQGAVATHQAAIAGADVARKALDDAVLYAPFAGVVALRAAQAGERVSVDAKVLELVDLGQLEVEVPLSPSDSVDVRVGQVATLQVEDRREPTLAKVKRISPSAQVGSRSVLVYLAIDHPEGLRHGLFAKGTLGLQRKRLLAVPESAVRYDRARPYVQVIEGTGDQRQVRHKPIVLGLRGSDAGDNSRQTWVGVEGLDAGSQVLQGHVGALREGLRVTFTAEAPAHTSPLAVPR
jgi:RND family efflux transporter MFP subunit